MTLLEIRNRVRVLINEPSGVSGAAWLEDTEIDMFVNDAYQEFYSAYLSVVRNRAARKSGLPIKTDAKVSTVSGTANYDVPDNTLEIMDLWYKGADGKNSRVKIITEREVERLYKREEWVITRTGVPEWAYIVRNTLHLRPIPDYSGTDNLILIYRRKNIDKSTTVTAALALDADIPSDIPTPFHHKLVYYVVWAYWNKKEEPRLADRYMALHQAALEAIPDAVDVKAPGVWRVGADVYPGKVAERVSPGRII